MKKKQSSVFLKIKYCYLKHILRSCSKAYYAIENISKNFASGPYKVLWFMAGFSYCTSNATSTLAEPQVVPSALSKQNSSISSQCQLGSVCILNSFAHLLSYERAVLFHCEPAT